MTKYNGGRSDGRSRTSSCTAPTISRSRGGTSLYGSRTNNYGGWTSFSGRLSWSSGR